MWLTGLQGELNNQGVGPAQGELQLAPTGSSSQRCIQYHTGSLNEATVRGPHPLGAGTPAFITLPPGVSRQGQDSLLSKKPGFTSRADEAHGPATPQEVVCQADQNRSRHTGDTGRTGPLGLHCLTCNMEVTST